MNKFISAIIDILIFFGACMCFILLLLGTKEVLAGGMVHVTPYFEVGAGYAPSSTPWSQQMDDQYYSWKGSNPVAIFAGGIEVRWDKRQTGYLDIGGTHISNWTTGWPVNREPETSLDMIHVKYRWRW